MKKPVRLLLAILILANIALFGQDKKAYVSEQLVKRWATPQGLKVPESAHFDKQRNIIFVSNVNGDPTVKDNNGFISKVTPEGKIESLEWVTGLNAPKGIGVYGDMLYVADIDRVAEIDINKGRIVTTYDVPRAKFLNDVAIGKTGTVYISDSDDNAVYQIQDGKLTLLARSDELDGPNGLYVEDGDLLVGLQTKIVKIDLNTKAITDFINNTGPIDGLVPAGGGNYLFSDWKGHVYIGGPGMEKKLLLDNTPVNMNAADIDYVIDKKLLLVPTFSGNSVVAYTMR